MFSYRLTSGDLIFLINQRSSEDKIPTVSLTIGSESCWSPGFDPIYNRFIKWLSAIGGDIIKNQVSEVHLATDFIGVPISSLNVDDKRKWITRTTRFASFGSHRKLETFSLGTGDLMLRIYDKIQELKNSPHKLFTFMDAWGLSALVDTEVTRVEFQVRRPFLKEMKFTPASEGGIDTYDDLIESLNSIWAHCTQVWARHCSSVVDIENKHQSRASNSSFWDDVTNVQWAGEEIRTKQKPRPKKDYVALRKQYLGIDLTLAAFHKVNTEDIDHIIDIGKSIFEEDITSFYLHDEVEFFRRINKKKLRFMNQSQLFKI